eukprot:14727-Karenia_brevis.AAC.1
MVESRNGIAHRTVEMVESESEKTVESTKTVGSARLKPTVEPFKTVGSARIEPAATPEKTPEIPPGISSAGGRNHPNPTWDFDHAFVDRPCGYAGTQKTVESVRYEPAATKT